MILSVSIGGATTRDFRNTIIDEPSPFSAQRFEMRCECTWIEVFPRRRMDLELARLSVFARQMGPKQAFLGLGEGVVGCFFMETGSIKSVFLAVGDIT